MAVIPIQVTEQGVLIPKTYLPGAQEARDVDIIFAEDYVLVRPRAAMRGSDSTAAPKLHRFDFIATGHTRNPDASIEFESVLAREEFKSADIPR